ncbi:MAG: RNA 2',3'-cyclic phosphodiesterase [Proteobacteria bacterium]|nr:RNA 2',3'-cyclic phosphodiesterase [Pseudomonadota bacterium]
MIRLFAALALPDDLRARLAGMQGRIDGARWVAPENMHITLRFIGEVSEAVAGDIVEALEDLRCPGFPVTLTGAGRFGSGDRTRAIWVGVERTPEIVGLHARIDRALIRIGLAPEGRKYIPHMTLARFGGGGSRGSGGRNGGRGRRADGLPDRRVLQWLEAHGGFFALPFEARAFVLYESHLGRNGPHYAPVAEFPLLRRFIC